MALTQNQISALSREELEHALLHGQVTPVVYASELAENLARVNKHARAKDIPKELLTSINRVIADNPEVGEAIRENTYGYLEALEDNVPLSTYFSAVTYVSFRLQGLTKFDSWKRTFPEKYQEYLVRGTSKEQMYNSAGRFDKHKVVAKISKFSSVPTWIINQDVYQKAINRQAWLMENAKSEKVQSDAANSLLTHLKRPDEIDTEVEVEVEQNDTIVQLQKTMLELAKAQRDSVQSGGVTAKVVAESTIITEEELEDVEEGEFKELP